MATEEIEEKEETPEKPEKKPLTEQELARKHNHAEINRELDKHFNGSDRDKKIALGNVEKAFGNLAKVKDKK